MKKIVLSIMLMLGGLMLMSQNTFAENVDTSRLQFNAMPYNSNNYDWTAELLYNQDIYGLKYARLYRFKSANFTTTGTNAVIHFETKIDYYQPQAPFKDPFVNLDYMHVQACSFNDGSNLEILGENVLYLKKYETYQSGAYGAGEITFYGDVALKGFTPNQNGYLKCMIGSFDYAFMSTGATSYNSNSTSFVNNYINITMTDNVANELLAQQIAQTQQMLAAQQQIINQNQQIINNIDDINNSITDSTVSGNFNLSAIQPFGPIATITNNVLSLPLILVGVGTCTDVVAPLPYINENLIIECPHKWLPQMAGQFYNMADGIFSAGLYFILARYIFKKVQNLRDPNNDDEEYLDI